MFCVILAYANSPPYFTNDRNFYVEENKPVGKYKNSNLQICKVLFGYYID